MERKQYKAKCLCGSVNIVASPEGDDYQVCHCDTCKTWNGGPQFVIPCGREVAITGEVTEFHSSAWAARGFCAVCGTHLYYKLIHSGTYNIMLGALDIDKAHKLELAMQFCIDKKPDYYDLQQQSETLTEAQMIEMYS